MGVSQMLTFADMRVGVGVRVGLRVGIGDWA